MTIHITQSQAKMQGGTRAGRMRLTVKGATRHIRYELHHQPPAPESHDGWQDNLRKELFATTVHTSNLPSHVKKWEFARTSC